MKLFKKASVWVTASCVMISSFSGISNLQQSWVKIAYASRVTSPKLCPLRQEQAKPILAEWENTRQESLRRYRLFGVLAGGTEVQFKKLVPFVIEKIRLLSPTASWTVNSATETILSKIRVNYYFSFSHDESIGLEQAVFRAVDEYRKKPIVLSSEPYQNEQELLSDTENSKKFQKELYKEIEKHKPKQFTTTIALSRGENWTLYRSLRKNHVQVHVKVVDAKEYEQLLNSCGGSSSTHQVPYGFLCLKNTSTNELSARELLLAVLLKSHNS